jgi:hypothetical protein
MVQRCSGEGSDSACRAGSWYPTGIRTGTNYVLVDTTQSLATSWAITLELFPSLI